MVKAKVTLSKMAIRFCLLGNTVTNLSIGTFKKINIKNTFACVCVGGDEVKITFTIKEKAFLVSPWSLLRPTVTELGL